MTNPFDTGDTLKSLQALLHAHRQNNRILRLSFPHNDAPSSLLVANRLDAIEALSRDFDFNIEVLSNSPSIELKDVQGKMVTIEQVRDDGTMRYFNGYVFEFRFIKNDAGYSFYEMILRPGLAYLRATKDTYLFHNRTVENQTTDIFSDYDELRDWKAENLGTDEPMTNACQWDESDYNYLHRRWEAKGWHYHYEHRKDGHTLVLSGDSMQSQPIEGGGDITWQGNSGVQQCGITQFSAVRRAASTSYVARSFDFKNPRPLQAEVPTNNQQGKIPQLEVYEYTGAYGFKDTDEGDAYVRLRMEEIEGPRAKYFEAKGNKDHAQPGRSFTLSGHLDLAALDQDDHEFLILEVVHSASNNYETGAGVASEYSNAFTCIRKKIPFRPGRNFNSFEPKIYGVQTATVVGPDGQEIHTDEYARVRVRFHWDRVGQASAFIRVASTFAGDGYGHDAIPRVKQEVVVQYLNGSPDRPIITGRLFNANNMPPRFSHTGGLPTEKALSGWSTQEIHGTRQQHLRFDDTTGEISTQLASDHGATHFNQGSIGTPRNNGKSGKRGEGFEVRTDLAGAIRAAQGLLVTTDSRPTAGGKVLDRQELIGQLETALAIAKQLAELAETHEADSTDTAPTQKLVDQITNWDANKPGGAAAIALSAPDGIALSSANAITTSSSTNLDMIAAQDANISTGRKILLRAGQGLSAFVKKAGMKLIAAAGKISMIAQSDEMELGAAKRLHMYSLEELLLEAKLILLRGEGAQISIGNGKIVLSCASPVTVEAPSFNFVSAGGGSLSLPSMPSSTLATDERIAFVGRGGNARENLPYEVRDSSGAVQDAGSSAADGATQSIVTDNVIKTLTVQLKP